MIARPQPTSGDPVFAADLSEKMAEHGYTSRTLAVAMGLNPATGKQYTARVVAYYTNETGHSSLTPSAATWEILNRLLPGLHCPDFCVEEPSEGRIADGKPREKHIPIAKRGVSPGNGPRVADSSRWEFMAPALPPRVFGSPEPCKHCGFWAACSEIWFRNGDSWALLPACHSGSCAEAAQ